ncbi:LOW QUALITY PROTEIN: hypothetical protein V2J09_012875 [Rumex salicifolius]
MYGAFPSNTNPTPLYISNNFTPIIQCDHGREFDNNELRSFFSSNGVLLRFSCPHTSQQNGKAERMIRTITNTIRTLLFHDRLPPRFWVEALPTATYLLNITPTTTLAMRTPHQALFRQIPTYTHLRVFGCLCFPNPTATTAHKLEPRTRPCVFLGYALQHRSYRCLDLESRKVIISRHVIFDKSVFHFMTPYNSPTSDDSEDPLPLFPSDPTVFRPTTAPTAPAPRTTLRFGAHTYAPPTYYSRRPKPPANPPPLTTSRRPDPSPPPSHQSPAYHGALQYLTFTRPDISYAVQQICIHMHDPRASHLQAMKRVLRYIQGTAPLGLTITPGLAPSGNLISLYLSYTMLYHLSFSSPSKPDLALLSCYP